MLPWPNRVRSFTMSSQFDAQHLFRDKSVAAVACWLDHSSARQQCCGGCFIQPFPDSKNTSIDDAVNPFVRKGVVYWRSLSGTRRFPARSDMTFRGLAAILPYTVIVSVIDGGADFEYRYVGDAQRQAIGVWFKGLRVTQIEAGAPPFGAILRAAYEQVRASGAPSLVQGRIDHQPPDTQLLYHETAFLPLGADGSAVDHILIVGVQIPAPIWETPKEKIVSLKEDARSRSTQD